MYVCQCLYVCTSSEAYVNSITVLNESDIIVTSLSVKVATKRKVMLCHLLKYILIGSANALTLNSVELNETNWLDPCTAEGYIG